VTLRVFKAVKQCIIFPFMIITIKTKTKIKQ